MLRKILNIKVIFTLLFSGMVAVSFASFSSIDNLRGDDKDKDKKKSQTENLSLKDLQNPDSFFSISSISSGSGDVTSLSSMGKFRFINPGVLPERNVGAVNNSSSVEINSSIKVHNGNQVVIYPYSYKLKPAPFSLFKSPIDR